MGAVWAVGAAAAVPVPVLAPVVPAPVREEADNDFGFTIYDLRFTICD